MCETVVKLLHSRYFFNENLDAFDAIGLHRRRNRVGGGGGGGGGGGQRGPWPPILGIMCITYAEFILDTSFGPPQSCLCSYASAISKALHDECLASVFVYRSYTN